MTALCVVQARIGSTRLPGKVLADLSGRPLLAFMLERLRPLPMDVVVATTDLERDDAVADVASGAGVAVVRGPEQDVLARFALTIDRHRPDVVVRLTADCPLVDPALVQEALRIQAEAGAAYVSNTLVRTFPDGLDVEAATADALLAADAEATDPAEREHVTPFLYRRPRRFPLRSFTGSELLGEERWTVDTRADLDVVREAVARLGGSGTWGWQEVLAALGRRVPHPAPGELRLRPALPGDGDRILAWRNDPDAVRFSRTGRSVSTEEHQAWYAATLNDPSTRIWIGERDGTPVGQVRVDVDDGVGLVSITVAPEARGHGLAGVLLRKLEQALHADLQVIRLVAEVKSDNEPSLRVFDRAGYREQGRRDDFVLLALSLGATPR